MSGNPLGNNGPTSGNSPPNAASPLSSVVNNGGPKSRMVPLGGGGLALGGSSVGSNNGSTNVSVSGSAAVVAAAAAAVGAAAGVNVVSNVPLQNVPPQNSSANQDLASLFECPVCFDYVLPPILQVRSVMKSYL